MVAYTIRRVLISIPVLVVATFLVFLIVTIGQDPLADLRARNPPPPQATIDAMRHQLYLDRSIPSRYWIWVKNLILHGNFGPSVRANFDIGQQIGNRMWMTFRLVILAVLLALVLAIIVGVVSAVRQYSKLDYVLTLLGFLFLSLPVFLFAIMLKSWAININQSTGTSFFKTLGPSTPGLSGGWWTHFYDTLGHLVLPTITLALTSFAAWSRFQRSSMLDVLNSDYMRLARAKGLSKRRVMVKHGLRTALIPLATQVALDIAAFLGGVIVTEKIFQWQGLGTMLLDSITSHDAYATLGWLLVAAIVVILFNLIADLLYAVLDPRIRLD